MKKKIIKWLLFLLIVSMGSFVYSQEEIESGQTNDLEVEVSSVDKPLSSQAPSALKKNREKYPFLNWINTKAYAATIDESEERIRLRKAWKRLLGADIFFPYFKAKEVEEWVREKAKIKFFNIKGKPEFNRNQIQYIFKIKF
jgi:hypothetical protein